MEWNVVFDLIDPVLLIVVAMCWCLGFTLKHTPHVEDWTIIYIVTIVAVLFVVWLQGFNPNAIIQGVLCGAFAVYGHQLIKQTKDRDRDESQ